MTHPRTTVYLVGAGPGDPGLLTCAAHDALAHADVCIYDYLANPALLQILQPECRRIYVGKSAGAHTLSQDQINTLLVETAQEFDGKKSAATIVRLKGGDPYVFGRGGEEAQHLHAAGIPFVVIPGITAGIAGPAYAGIPVTHRNLAATVTFVTGHESAEKNDQLTLDFAGLDTLLKAGGTVVFYMGIKNLPRITQRFRDLGLPDDLPAAVIQWATHPHQKTVIATLATIAQRVTAANITAPAITILGQVVSLHDSLNWFESRPLFGQKILVTRTRQQASELTTQLTALGATVLEAPTIALAEPEDWTPIDDALLHIPAYDWVVFTSANGVRAAWNRLTHLELDARHFGASEIAALGPATADALAAIGLRADLLPEKFVGEELAAALQEKIPDLAQKRLLLLRADIARPALREALQKASAQVDDLPIYRTIMPPNLPEEVLTALRDNTINWITFTSASTAENLHTLLPPDLREKAALIPKLSIGPITTAALHKLNWPPTLEAPQHDIPGMVTALRTYIKTPGS